MSALRLIFTLLSSSMPMHLAVTMFRGDVDDQDCLARVVFERGVFTINGFQRNAGQINGEDVLGSECE